MKAHETAEVVRIPQDRDTGALIDADPELARFVAGARELLSLELERTHGSHSEPPRPLPRPQPRPDARLRWVWMLGCAATIVGMVVGAGAFLDAQRSVVAARATDGLHSDHAVERETQFQSLEQRPMGSTAAARLPAAEPSDPTPPLPLVAAEPTDPEVASQRSPKPLLRSPIPEADLVRLDAQAQSLWRAGRLAEAKVLFYRILRQGGRHSRVELAFGDLFAIARQSGQNKELEQLWRAYLSRFPRGRFADDAKAGLCGRLAGKRGEECWSQYLSHFPDGAHRDHAARELGKLARRPH